LTLEQAGSLRRRTPLIGDSFDHFVLDIPDLRFYCCKLWILVLLLGLVNWLLAILQMSRSLSSDGWKPFCRRGMHSEYGILH
jgi:hypothetical protein